MSTVSKICDTVGRKVLADRLDKSKAAITNAVIAKKFPPSWYRVVRSLCEEQDIECPDSLFSFIEEPKTEKAGARI